MSNKKDKFKRTHDTLEVEIDKSVKKAKDYKDRTYSLMCCGIKMCIEYSGSDHTRPIGYSCHKCGAYVIAWKFANWKQQTALSSQQKQIDKLKKNSIDFDKIDNYIKKQEKKGVVNIFMEDIKDFLSELKATKSIKLICRNRLK